MRQGPINGRDLSATLKKWTKSFLRHENALLIIVFIGLLGGMSVMTNGLITRRVNIMNILLQSSIRGVASVGQSFVILSGGIDVSVGGVGLVCSLLGARLMTELSYLSITGQPMSIYPSIAIMLLVGALWGALNGVITSRVGVPPLIVTLGMWQITNGVSFLVSKGRSITGQPSSLTFFGSGTIAGVPVPVIIFISIAVVAYFVLQHTSFGRMFYAVGGNPTSAWLSGINVRKIIHSGYIISGLLAGLAGVIVVARVMSASGRTLYGLEIDSIAAATVGGMSLMGGRGSIIGVVIGVIIIGLIDNCMSLLGAEPSLAGIVKGSIIIAAVATDYIRRRG